MNADLKAFVESYKRKTVSPIITIKEYMEGKSHEAWKEYTYDMRERVKWTEDMDIILKEKYPNHITKEIARILKVQKYLVSNRARFLGLRKDKEFIREIAKKNQKTQFPKRQKENQTRNI